MNKPIFNEEWMVLRALGEGQTSKVYQLQHLHTGEFAALKVIKLSYMDKPDSMQHLQQEITIMEGLKQHKNIVGIRSYGTSGRIVKGSGKIIEGIVYILMDYVEGGLMFDFCQKMGGLGETAGKDFLLQMLDVLEFMHSKQCVHRDIKLENILLDHELNIKLTDFGFSTFKSIEKLNSYHGTKTYMAPEIKKGIEYNGKSTDIFSVGVVLFILVRGVFPFLEAIQEDGYYSLLLSGQYEQYWKAVKGQNLSNDLKDLLVWIFANEGSNRPTIQQIRDHPWLKSHQPTKIRVDLAERYFGDRSNVSTQAS